MRAVLEQVYIGVTTTMAILWYHFCLWGSMFVGSQTFPGLWGHNFIGSVIGTILNNSKHILVDTFEVM